MPFTTSPQSFKEAVGKKWFTDTTETQIRSSLGVAWICTKFEVQHFIRVLRYVHASKIHHLVHDIHCQQVLLRFLLSAVTAQNTSTCRPQPTHEYKQSDHSIPWRLFYYSYRRLCKSIPHSTDVLLCVLDLSLDRVLTIRFQKKKNPRCQSKMFYFVKGAVGGDEK